MNLNCLFKHYSLWKEEFAVVSRGHGITKSVTYYQRPQWWQESNRFCVKRTLYHQEGEVLPEATVKPTGQPFCVKKTLSPRRWCFVRGHSDAKKATVFVSRGHYITKRVTFYQWPHWCQEGNRCCVKRTLYHQEGDVLPAATLMPRGQPLLCQKDTVPPRGWCFTCGLTEAKRATIVVSRGHYHQEGNVLPEVTLMPRGQPLLCQEDTITKRVTFCQRSHWCKEAKRATVVVSRGHCITKRWCFPRGHTDTKQKSNCQCQEDTVSQRRRRFAIDQWRQDGNHCCVKRTLHPQEGDVSPEATVTPRGQPLLCQEDTILPRGWCFARGHRDAKRATVVVSRGHCITKRVTFRQRPEWCQKGNRYCVKRTLHHEVMVLARRPLLCKDTANQGLGVILVLANVLTIFMKLKAVLE